MESQPYQLRPSLSHPLPYPSSASEKRQHSNLSDVESPPQKRSKAPSQDIPSIPPPIPPHNTTQEPGFISRNDPRIAAWLDTFDEADPPETPKAYLYSSKSDADICSETDSCDTEDYDTEDQSEVQLGSYLGRATYKAEWLKSHSFRTLTLLYNSIRILYWRDATPTWVEEHLDTIDTYTNNDIPVDFAAMHQRYYREFASNVEDKRTCLNEFCYLMGIEWLGLDGARRILFWKGSLPPIKDYPKYTLHNPKPSLILGYNFLPMTDGLRNERFSKVYDILKCMHMSAVSCPYLIIESECHLGSLFVAENRSFVSGRISLDRIWSFLGDRDLVFLLSTMPNFARLFVMWRDVEKKITRTGEVEESPAYRIKLVDSFDMDMIENAEKLRNAIFRIQHWARKDRLPRIMVGLRKWMAHGYPRHKYHPIGRERVPRD
ncbi:uncharacterized protein F4812DRAFT_114036 [Daldinia caldariorum]|uniref:uncharacterized protein n=1 Tax=Daldinia caldariorum TaxID=326644 RepID=UPI002008AE03|nr:uncharacterized protein F4812DRAFT_114036 [Daldinia caldariorum]KAI1465834.1 hypothetical protein F4812DRAFT_114036 [Daldinia caldariorum]